MKIAKLEPSSHKEGRWLVFLEDGALLRVGEGDVVRLSLYTGKELTEAETESLIFAAGRNRLSERAVNLLSARAMSRKELLDKLTAPERRRRKPGESPREMDVEAQEREREALRAEAEAVADRLCELGLLNDGEYARAVVRHYGGKGYGVKKIREELYRRGVPRQYWEEALCEAEEPESCLDELVRRKLRGAEPTRENLKKASDYLARRGFGWEDISAALRRYEEEFRDGEL